MHRSPFDETLYLDGDTRVFGDLGELFRLLERFDLALAHVPRFWGRRYQRQLQHYIPASFPVLNTGVILYRRTPAITDFFQAWRTTYREAGNSGGDQTSFREVLWLSDLRLAVLPAIYNTRRYDWLGRLLSDQPAPVILHCNLFHPTKSSRTKRLAWRVVGMSG